MRQHAHHVFFRFADRQAADRDAVETDFLQTRQRFITQMFEHAALHDAEQGIRIFAAVEFIARALRPAQRHAHRFRRLFFGRGAAVDFIGCAFVELHHDVGIQRALDLHRNFG